MSIGKVYQGLKDSLIGVKQIEDRTLQDYYATFSTIPGKRVLSNILSSCKFFLPAESEEDVILQNFAKNLLIDMGVYNEDNIDKLVTGFLALSKLQVQKEELIDSSDTQ